MKMAPWPQVVDHIGVVHDLVAHVDGRAELAQARSTISMARSTPAQKPRGSASSSSWGPGSAGMAVFRKGHGRGAARQARQAPAFRIMARQEHADQLDLKPDRLVSQGVIEVELDGFAVELG